MRIRIDSNDMILFRSESEEEAFLLGRISALYGTNKTSWCNEGDSMFLTFHEQELAPFLARIEVQK